MTHVAAAVTGLTIVLAGALALGAMALAGPPRAGRNAFVAGCAGLAVWCASLAAQLLSTDPEMKQRLGGGIYLGVCIAVYSLARCLIQLAGRPRVGPVVWLALAVPGVVTPLLVGTGWRDLVLRDFRAPGAQGPPHSESGPWFFVHTVWAYGLLAGSLLIFAVVAQRAPEGLRRQAHLLAFVVAAPLLANLVFVSGLVTMGDYDPTPYTVVLSLAGLGWGLRRARLIDGQIGMVSVARDRVVEAMSDPVLTLDRDGRVLDMNPAARALTGAAASALGAPVADLLPGWPGASAARDGGDPSFVHDGRTYDVALTRLPGDRATDVRVAVLRDATRRERSEQTSRERADVSAHNASHDDLTGLPNRTAAFAVLTGLLQGPSPSPLALVVLDLDGFKALNDSFGHRAGDDVLRELSGRLSGAVPDDVLVARLGGDEFAVVAPSRARGEAEGLAQRLVEAVRVPFHVGHADVRLGGSAGVALAPEHGASPDTLMYAADVAMYDAKRERAGVAVYEPAEGQRQPRRLMLSGELRDAIEQDAIDVFYQPQRDAHGDLVGLEALARWQHPQRGLLMPGQFLPLADQSALMTDLTDVVLSRSFADLARWRERGLAPRLSVNVSERDLRDPRLVRRVSDRLDASGLPPDALTLEVTENALVTTRDAAGQLDTLRQVGVRLSLDDFGTGFAPLATLRRLSVDEIKIDRTFVSGMTGDDDVLVRALLNFGHDLGLTVVAEGVESHRERAALLALHCDALQGYLMGMPAPPEAIEFGRVNGAGAARPPDASG